MLTLTVVTGNAHKLAEWQRLVPADFKLESVALDLDEIQSLDVSAIVIDKVKRAYAQVGKPVVVEDVSAGLDKLGGLPGPFMKFFEQRLGKDALFQLARQAGDPVTIRCAMAYYDGRQVIDVVAEETGTVVAPRGDHGFGFDYCVVLTGQTKTYAELTPAAKDVISHRAHALDLLLARLRQPAA